MISSHRSRAAREGFWATAGCTEEAEEMRASIILSVVFFLQQGMMYARVQPGRRGLGGWTYPQVAAACLRLMAREQTCLMSCPLASARR